jgi:CBS domain-containing protein
MKEPNPVTMHREAETSTTRHLGPTADQLQRALESYLSAVATPMHPAPLPSRPSSPASAVSDVMTRAVVAAHEGAPFKEIVGALARNRVSAVPVLDGDRKVIGVVSASDLISRVASGSALPPRGARGNRAIRQRKAHGLIAGELMTAPAVTVRAWTPIVEAAQIAARARVRHLPVVDGDGVLIGIVTRSDLLRVFLRGDDEIRAEVQEYLRRVLGAAPTAVSVDVTEGVVSFGGELERELMVLKLVEHVRGVSGVVDVVREGLTARFDTATCLRRRRRAATDAGTNPADRPYFNRWIRRTSSWIRRSSKSSPCHRSQAFMIRPIPHSAIGNTGQKKPPEFVITQMTTMKLFTRV